IHFDPYDVSRIWVRDHWRGGWITLFWKHLHRVAAPFGELAWGHTPRVSPGARGGELAHAVADLLQQAHHRPVRHHRGPPPHDRSAAGGARPANPGRRARPVAPQTKPSPPAARIEPAPVVDADTDGEPGQADDSPEHIAKVIPMPIFDPFTEADKRW